MQWTAKPEHASYSTVLGVGYAVFVVGTLLHTLALLAYVVFPKAAYLHRIYLCMLTVDVSTVFNSS